MELKNSQISLSQAHKLADLLMYKGFPTPGKILILSPTGEQRTKSGIIISSTVDKKDLPRKGVVIQDNSSLPGLIVGTVVTYGMYAGKELHLSEDLFESIGVTKEDYTFTVLSESEVIYTETNK